MPTMRPGMDGSSEKGGPGRRGLSGWGRARTRKGRVSDLRTMHLPSAASRKWMVRLDTWQPHEGKSDKKNGHPAYVSVHSTRDTRRGKGRDPAPRGGVPGQAQALSMIQGRLGRAGCRSTSSNRPGQWEG